MIENRFFDTDDALQEEITRLIIGRKLIPVIGSGFTRACPAREGTVPTGEEMTDYLKQAVAKVYGKEKTHYKDYQFLDLCTMYDKKVPIEDRFHYFKSNFTDVKLPVHKSQFLSLDWPYLYTLNIDDGIEGNCPQYQVILPRKEYFQQYINTFFSVFKIHGDVHYYLKYIEHEELIFNKRQYIESLRNNKKMLMKFQEDFSDNNLLYIGCSLRDEPDLLSVIRSAMSNNRTHHETYYLSRQPLSEEESDLLEDYGITICVVVPNPDNFYKRLIELVKDRKAIPQAVMEYYREPEIVSLSKEQSDLSFLLHSDNLIRIPFDRKFYKPHFFISREATNQVLQDLKMNSPIHILYGHRISGKTYCLFDIYERVRDKERYFFPSDTKITDEMLVQMLDKASCLFVFDTGCLTVEQLTRLTKQKKQLENRGSYMVVAVNTSDRNSIDLLVENIWYKTTCINNLFTRDEEKTLNTVLENSNIPTFLFEEYRQKLSSWKKYRVTYTLLDNLYRIAVDFSAEHPEFVLPDLSGINSVPEFALVLLLATQQTVSSYDIYYFDIMLECNQFTEQYPMLAQFVYFEEGVSRRDSRQKMVVNARYYLLKVLGDYANDKEKHELILEAYRYLYEHIAYAEDSFDITRKMLDFIKFDVINDVFYRKNNVVISLIKYLYEQLEPEMNVNPQFKHQRAKSILWLCDKSLDDVREAAEYIALAKHDTKNRLSHSQSIPLKISLEHIRYTQSKIYGRLCALEHYTEPKNIELAIQYYNEALFSPENAEELKALREKKAEKRFYNDLKDLINFLRDNGEGAMTELREKALMLSEHLGCF